MVVALNPWPILFVSSLPNFHFSLFPTPNGEMFPFSPPFFFVFLFFTTLASIELTCWGDWADHRVPLARLPRSCQSVRLRV